VSVAVLMLLPTLWDNLEEWILRKTMLALKQQTFPIRMMHIYMLVTDRTLEATFQGVTKLMHDYVDTFTFLRSEGREGEKTRFPEMAEARNLLLEHGKKHPWCLFLDSDILMPKDAVRKLISNGKDVCGAMAKIPSALNTVENNFGAFTPNFQDGVRFATKRPDELMQVGFVNTTCMLINHRIANDPRVTFCCLMYDGDKQGSEDHSYCYLANLYGYKVYVDPSINCKHYRRTGRETVDLLKA
jgi:cellulose synthase/poly-beta-1,6-N-acetylglucosamine synthase-like glycosyltransferase